MNKQQPRHTASAGAAVGSWMMALALASSVGTAALMAMAAGSSAGLLGAGTDLPQPEPPRAGPDRR